MCDNKEPIFSVAVAGPTASGKTATAIALGQMLGGEIISCDSMQIYRGMDIGTAKPTKEERACIPHHLIDFVPPDRSYSAADYAVDAMAAVRDIAGRNRLPVFCGGTGLYLNAVRTDRHSGMPDVRNEVLRRRLTEEGATESGRDALYRRLLSVDPQAAAATHKNNLRRVIRALEIYEETGIPKSEWDRRSGTLNPALNMKIFLLDFRNRENLYRRINARVDAMLAEGLMEEAEDLYRRGLLAPDSTAAQAIGYKELIPFIENRIGKEEAIENLKTATRRYAKRQLTWFRAIPDAVTLYPDDGDTLRDGACLANEIVRIMKEDDRRIAAQ